MMSLQSNTELYLEGSMRKLVQLQLLYFVDKNTGLAVWHFLAVLESRCLLQLTLKSPYSFLIYLPNR